ncbi:MAG: hypothetical protein ACK4WD_03095 [Flavobacteriales bacterium]|jgi:hypothetical protein
MNYELKFYYGENTNEVVFLGQYPLADKYTYDHYLSLINHKIPFSVWFNHYEGLFIHRNVVVDANTMCNEGEIDNGNTKVIFILSMDANNIQLLTDEEYRNQNKINELINQISKEDVSRFFRK